MARLIPEVTTAAGIIVSAVTEAVLPAPRPGKVIRTGNARIAVPKRDIRGVLPAVIRAADREAVIRAADPVIRGVLPAAIRAADPVIRVTVPVDSGVVRERGDPGSDPDLRRHLKLRPTVR